MQYTLFKKIFKKRTFFQFTLLVLSYFPKIKDLIPDIFYLKLVYRATFNRKLNLKNPQTFNEKLQWLKLYHHRPEYTMMADKYAVRKYIADTIGEEYLIPLIGKWDSPADIDFDALPNQFVLKCNHNSGLGMCIGTDKSTINVEKVKKELKKGLQQNYFLHGREWSYKNIKPCIIAEKLIENKNKAELVDYKLMCFNGKVQCTFICSERFLEKGLHVTFFDNNWERLPFIRKYPASTKEFPKPLSFDKMIELAEKLSNNIPFVRVDFYEVDGEIFFGELTFYPGCGLSYFAPEEWDYKLGAMLKLPSKDSK